MNKINNIFLPGTDKQISFFLDLINAENKSVLIIGSGSEEIAKIFYREKAGEIYIIVDNEDSLVQSRFLLSELKEVNVRMMDFSNTDFKTGKFDIVYSQGATGTNKRNKIIKEIASILKPGGYFCTGEIVSLKDNPPQFVKDIWEKSNLAPLYKNEFKEFYLSRGFDLIQEKDLSGTLKDFYSKSKELLSESSRNFSVEEKKYFRHITRSYGHEANAYLKLGGDKHIGYGMMILQSKSKMPAPDLIQKQNLKQD